MLEMARSTPRLSRGIIAGGLVTTALFVTATSVALRTGSYDTWGALIIVPVLVAATLPLLVREARRAGDPRFLRLLVLALLLKLLGAFVRYFLDFYVYGGQTDGLRYHEAGIQWARWLQAGRFEGRGEALIGTNFMELLTGIVYRITRPTLLGGFIVFSWLAFLGLFSFYRAFVLAVPEGRSLTYARFVFFLPSLLFWPSGTGKDAWMVFTLGVASLGAAHLLTGRTWRGIAWLSAGLWLALLVRPHVAAMLGIAVVIAAAVSMVWPRDAKASLTRRIAVLAMAAVAAILLVSIAQDYLESSGVSTEGGVSSALGEVERRTEQGGSEFRAIVVTSPTEFPRAAVTILFRPFPFEADNAQALVSSLEASALLLICIARYRWILAALRSVRRQPYVLLGLVFTVLFIFAASSVANFGILVRQRVQVLPFFLIFLAIPPRSAGGPPAASERTHHPVEMTAR